MNQAKIKPDDLIKRPVSISMTDSLKNKIQKEAAKDGRTVSDYVCRLIEKNI